MTVRVIVSAALLGALALPAMAAASPADGQKLFQQRCAACHAVNGVNGIGPALNGVSGRKAASYKGYGYTAALAASKLVWTDGALDTFLAAPTKVVPGSKMVIPVPAPAQRADVIAYLRTLK